MINRQAMGLEDAERSVSVVIPVHNEVTRLPPFLKTVVTYFEGRGEPYEVLIMDGGSDDGTPDLVRRFSAKCAAVSVHVLPHNRGKGYAVRQGMRRARGRHRLMADADGATPITEFARLERAIEAGADIAIGSRVLQDEAVTRQNKPHRRLAGTLFNVVVRCLGVRDVSDTQCGFKLFRAEAADDVFEHARIDGFGFDVEVLLLAQQRRYRTVEVPVTWFDQPGSKVSVASEALRMVGQVLAVRCRLALDRTHDIR